MRKAITVRITKYTPNPTFRITYDDGSFKMFSLQCSKQAAQMRLAKIRDQIVIGSFELKDHKLSKAHYLTLRLFFKKLIAYLSKEIKLDNLKPKTVHHRVDTYAMFARIVGPNTVVASINKHHIDKFFLALQEKKTQHGRPYSVETFKSYKRDLHNAWEYAIEHNHANSNPFRKYKLKGKKANESRRVISPDEKQRIIAHFDTIPSEWKEFAYHIANNTGARRGEIFKLKASSLFYDDVPGIGTIPGITLTGKGDKTREIPIDDITHELILKRIDIIKDINHINEILNKASFQNHTARIKRATDKFLLFEVIRPETITEAFRKIFRACGITDAHFHDIRKTFTTDSLSQGYSMESMKEWLGHEDIRTTQTFYGRVEFKRMAMEMQRVRNST
jgi:integrase